MYVVMDKDGNPWGPFDDPSKATLWAAREWPDEPMHDERYPPHREGWVVVALRPAN
jgi:hypothetical protein